MPYLLYALHVYDGSRRGFNTRYPLYVLLLQDDGSRRCSKMRYPLCALLLVYRDSRPLFKTMVQHAILPLCTPTCRPMNTLCRSYPESAYIIAICITEQSNIIAISIAEQSSIIAICIAEKSYLRQKNPVFINLKCRKLVLAL